MSANPFDEPDWPLEPCAGDTHTDDQGRLWTFCAIVHGVRGGRWAYQVIVDRSWKGIIVDTRQNLQAAQFAGMLAIPWAGLTKLGWVLDRKHCPPVREKLEPEPVNSVRFERLESPPEDN